MPRLLQYGDQRRRVQGHRRKPDQQLRGDPRLPSRGHPQPFGTAPMQRLPYRPRLGQQLQSPLQPAGKDHLGRSGPLFQPGARRPERPDEPGLQRRNEQGLLEHVLPRRRPDQGPGHRHRLVPGNKAEPELG